MKKLYNFKNLEEKLDTLNYPKVTESRFEVVRKDLSEEERRGNVVFKEDGVYIMINGLEHRGYMYMKSVDIGRYGFPKFHITTCQKIIEQRSSGRFERSYFWHNSNTVNLTDRTTGEIHENVQLELCSFCRNQSNINNFNNTKGFFNLLDIQEQTIANPEDVDIFGYVKDWRQISKKFRVENDYTCDSCNIKMEHNFDKRFIQVHHRNGNKLSNVRENLQCLCILCHANADEHHVGNFSNKKSVKEINAFIVKYREQLTMIENKFLKSWKS